MLNAPISTGVQLQCPEPGVRITRGKELLTFRGVFPWRSCPKKCRETIGCRYWTWYKWFKPLRLGSVCITYADTDTKNVTSKIQYEGAISGARNCGSITTDISIILDWKSLLIFVSEGWAARAVWRIWIWTSRVPAKTIMAIPAQTISSSACTTNLSWITYLRWNYMTTANQIYRFIYFIMYFRWISIKNTFKYLF